MEILTGQESPIVNQESAIPAMEKLNQETLESRLAKQLETPIEVAKPATEVVKGPSKPAYNPNYKYRVYDKELEFDEVVKPVIKDPDTEKKIRELFEKAGGLDVVKPKYQKIKEEFGGIKDKYTKLEKTWDVATRLAHNDDLEEFFKVWQIPEEKLYKHVYNKLAYEQLPKEQQDVIARNKELAERANMLEMQNQELASKFNQKEQEEAKYNLMTALNNTEDKQIIEMIDSKLGQGTFAKEVIAYGLLHENQGITLSAEDAVKAVAQRYKAFSQPVMQQQLPVQQQAPVVQKPTIPNIAGDLSSPAKKIPRSIMDLQKLYNEQYGS